MADSALGISTVASRCTVPCRNRSGVGPRGRSLSINAVIGPRRLIAARVIGISFSVTSSRTFEEGGNSTAPSTPFSAYGTPEGDKAVNWTSIHDSGARRLPYFFHRVAGDDGEERNLGVLRGWRRCSSDFTALTLAATRNR